PAQTLTPLGANCAIPLGASGSTTHITIPHLAGGRIWFSIGSPLTFLVNPGPALVFPSVSNPSDPNIDLMWDFCEFTFNSTNLWANISMVDFVAIPIALTSNGAAGTQTALGLPAGALDTVSAALQAQSAADGQGWNQLVVTNGGANLRALSPNNGIVQNPSLLSGYFDGYLDQVWSKYSSQTLSIDTQGQWGTVTGNVSGGVLDFPGVGSFAKPSSADIFSCNSGPFNTSGVEMGALTARISAAMNRTTLLIDSDQPAGENPADYYQYAQTNHYARIVHATSLDGRGYAFPYDDVAPTGGVDQSGAVVDPDPTLLTVTLSPVHGGGGGGSSTPPIQLQAEDGTLHGLGTEAIYPGYTGTGYVAGWNKDGQWVDLHPNVSQSGSYSVTLRYSAAAGNASRYIYVNGSGVVNNLTLPGTGSWSSWNTVTIPGVALNAGANTISVIYNSSLGSSNYVNLDEVTVQYTG
ncbi:carbohydrate-binding protein, partial [Catenulispora sp. NF23]|uniref:beta-1,3-glucanase family protein n=1 Tax=Catenulispora pinistramenti TaxID=2705254 RepID=UPI001BA5E262